jgi:hypothetical protein
MGIQVRYERQGSESFVGELVGCSPVQLGVLFVRRADNGQIVACDGDYLVAA